MDGLKSLQSGIRSTMPQSPKDIDSSFICRKGSFESVESDTALEKTELDSSIDAFKKGKRHNRHRRSNIVLIGNKFWNDKWYYIRSIESIWCVRDYEVDAIYLFFRHFNSSATLLDDCLFRFLNKFWPRSQAVHILSFMRTFTWSVYNRLSHFHTSPCFIPLWLKYQIL